MSPLSGTEMSHVLWSEGIAPRCLRRCRASNDLIRSRSHGVQLRSTIMSILTIASRRTFSAMAAAPLVVSPGFVNGLLIETECQSQMTGSKRMIVNIPG